MVRFWIGILMPVAMWAQTSPSALASLSGRITNSSTGQAVPGVNLTLLPIPERTGKQTFTKIEAFSQLDGCFRFDNLAAGSYYLSAHIQGFLRWEYKTQSQSGVTTTLELQKDQQIANLAVILTPQPSIAGKVTDDAGRPLVRVRVEALGRGIEDGHITLGAYITANTDSAGAFKIEDLWPGKCYLAARSLSETTEPGPVIESAPSETAPSRNLPLVRTYYPNSLDLSGSVALVLAGGQDLTGINIRFRRAARFHIRGKIEGKLPEGFQQQDSKILLGPINSTEFVGLVQSVTPSGSGNFDIPNVASGSYNLRLIGYRKLDRHSLARLDVEVGLRDLNDLVLTIAPRVTLTGHIHIANDDQPLPSGTTVALSPTEYPAFNGYSSAEAGPDGNFVIGRLDPGQYEVRSFTHPSGTYIKTILFNRQDITGKMLDLSPGGPSQLDILFRKGVAEIDGTCRPLSGRDPPTASPYIVILIPEIVAADGSDILLGGVDQRGMFVFAGVPPGRYSVFATDWSDSGDWRSPDFRRLVQSRAVSIELGENDRKQIQLTPISTADLEQAVAQLGLIHPN